ncbi:thioredoxin [Pseudomarimonas salicorniae]|uniref:Thioredoxin n=1 Tax=Pseudomarimonas salicorniae TaxID=2933270 RepID=A0ABT0GGV9_9GAMM|nr:thioredoxin [Lysobacter sp. CAU 1642]MCK7593766.1 thioredoxin [Lysobacter sp. CAU 1642]
MFADTPAAPSTQPHSFDVRTESFEQDVLVRSTEVPVLVDFWADWCAPCKQLKPVLEKLAAEYGGAFVLAKVNSDEEQQLPALFGVRSLPTVILLKDGRPVDGFMGAVPESQIRQFLTQHGVEPLPAEPAEPAPDTRTPQQQIADLETQIAAEPDNAELQLDLAVALSRAGEVQRAATVLDGLPANLAADDRAKRVHATLDFAAALTGAPSAAELEARLAKDENDHAARHLLGVHALVGGETEAALQQFLELLRRDKAWNDGAARRALVDAFKIIDDEDLVGKYRRKMASLLF